MLSVEELYHFDVRGWLVVESVLTPEQTAACRVAAPEVEDLEALHREPTLLAHLEQLIGATYAELDEARAEAAKGGAPYGQIGLEQEPIPDAPFRVDSAIAVVPTPRPELQLGGREPDRVRRLRYDGAAYPGLRRCRGVRAVWSVGEQAADGVVLVGGSHASTFEPPPGLLCGAAAAELHLDRPLLPPGALLLHCSTLLHGTTPHTSAGALLLEAEFVGNGVRPAAGYAPLPPPAWLAELSAEQRAVVAPRLTGQGTDAPPPAVPTPDDDLAREQYLWDLHGFLVVPAVMDSEWLAAANAAVIACAQQPSLQGALLDARALEPDASPLLTGAPRGRLTGLYELAEPHSAPFRRMIAHEAVMSRLAWMLGPGAHEVIPPACYVWDKGMSGQALHGGPEPAAGYSGSFGFDSAARQFHTDQVNVAWQLSDVGPSDGGFVAIRGSHKSAYSVHDVKSRETSLELGLVEPIPAKAGSVIFFLGGALVHGARSWVGAHQRRSTIMFFHPREAAIVDEQGNVVASRWLPEARL